MAKRWWMFYPHVHIHSLVGAGEFRLNIIWPQEVEHSSFHHGVAHEFFTEARFRFLARVVHVQQLSCAEVDHSLRTKILGRYSYQKNGP